MAAFFDVWGIIIAGLVLGFYMYGVCRTFIGSASDCGWHLGKSIGCAVLAVLWPFLFLMLVIQEEWRR